MSPPVISRVLRVELENFRGFKTPATSKAHAVNTDADIVLFSGANGHGKTSVLEALLLTLTGWYDAEHDPMKDARTYASRVLVSQSDGARAERFVLRLSVQTEGDADSNGSPPIVPLEVTWKSEDEGIVPMPRLPQASRLLQSDADTNLSARELDARLTGFFQGRVDRLFDQAATGRTFRDVFDPLPPPVLFFDDADMWESWRQLVRHARSEALFGDALDPSPAARREGLSGEWHKLRPLLEELAHLLGWGDLRNPETITDELPLDDVARRMAGVQSSGKVLRDDLRRHLDQELSVAIRRAEGEAGRDEVRVVEIQREIVACQRKKKALENSFPALEHELTLFDATNGLPDALQIFRSLEQHVKRWSGVQISHKGLERVRDEFSKVSAVDAGKCARMLEDFLRPRQEAKRKLDELNARMTELEKSKRRALTSEKLTALRDLETRLKDSWPSFENAWASCHEARRHESQRDVRARAVQTLIELENALSECERMIKKVTAPEPVILESLGHRVNAVMRRFSMVTGCLPVRVEAGDDRTDGHRSAHLVLADGRRLEHLSSGQKAQAALALMVAQNQAAAEYMAHRVILLDDITTDYDLSNLSRQALLLRQLAYGDNDPMNRRQVFLSSHHEDMTNQILDMLAPPHGNRMKIVRFRGWSTTNGPDYEVLEVEPSAKVNVAQLRTDLGAF
jgi:hypothetical protein